MCKICQKEFKNIISLGKHVRMLHNYTLIDYYIKYENFVIPKCKYCNNTCKVRGGITFTKTCCDYICKTKIKCDKKHSDEYKQNMSIIRKNWLKNNPDKHPWKNSKKFISVPCEKLKEHFRNSALLFESEIQPIENRFYSIDIVFIDKGIGIEVNGNQHYNENKELKPYYLERKKLIEEKGWTLYDIHYSKVYDISFITELVKTINGEKNNLDLNFNIEKREKRIIKCNCGEAIYEYSKSGECKKCSLLKRRKVERPTLEQLEIDIKELGYCGTGRKYGVSDTCIRKWITK